MWRAIWNGPFYIGRLTRPVSVGDVLMKLLETLWRVILLGIVAFGALLAVVLGNSWFENRRNTDAQRRTVIDVHADRSCQPGEFAVTIRNNSKYTLTYVSYRVNMTLRGADVTPGHLMDLWTGSAIGPGRSLTTCHSTAHTAWGSPTYYRTQEGTVLGASIERVSSK